MKRVRGILLWPIHLLAALCLLLATACLVLWPISHHWHFGLTYGWNQSVSGDDDNPLTYSAISVGPYRGVVTVDYMFNLPNATAETGWFFEHSTDSSHEIDAWAFGTVNFQGYVFKAFTMAMPAPVWAASFLLPSLPWFLWTWRRRRKRFRQKRGLCLQCAYDLRGLAADTEACPECGRAIEIEAATNPSGNSDAARTMTA